MLNYLFLALSALGTGAVYLFTDSVSPWWILPIFLGGFLAISLVYLLYCLIAGLLLPRTAPKKPSRYCSFMIRITMDWMMRLFHVRIRLTGTEKLPDEPFVLVSNHLSDFDPMVVLAVWKKRKIIYISKESNFKLPIAGPFIQRAGFLAIDRENGMRALRTLKRASEMMKEFQVDVGIYPEGTRSKTGELLEFKEGAFWLAKKADAPIVVMTTTGTPDIPKKIPFRRSDIRLDILDVIDRETVKTLSLSEISDKTRTMIAEHLGKN